MLKFDSLHFAVHQLLQQNPDAQRKIHTDANEASLAVAKLFEYTMESVMVAMSQKLRYAELFPVSTEVPAEDDIYKYQQVVTRGKAELVTHMSNDLPSVSASGVEVLSGIATFGSSYSYSIDQVAKSVKLGYSLDGLKSSAAQRAIAESFEATFLNGLTSPAVNGFLSAASGVPVVASPHANTWDGAATSDEIISDVVALILSTHNTTRNSLTADTILCGTKEYGILKTKYQSSTYKDDTIKTFLERTMGIAIEHWAELDGSGKVIAYKKDPEAIRAVVPLAFEQLAPEIKTFNFVINCRGKCGGLMIVHPKACAVMNGRLTTQLVLAGNTIA